MCQVVWCSGTSPKDWQTLQTQKWDRKECNIYCGISLLKIPGKVYEKCLEKRSREIIEPKLEYTQCGFHPGWGTTDKIFTHQQIFENLANMPKMSTHALSTSRKGLGSFCRSTVLMATCYWPSSHCIPTQKFVSVSVEFRGVTRVDGARGKKQVCRSHVLTWGLPEGNALYWRKYLWHC